MMTKNVRALLPPLLNKTLLPFSHWANCDGFASCVDADANGLQDRLRHLTNRPFDKTQPTLGLRQISRLIRFRCKWALVCLRRTPWTSAPAAFGKPVKWCDVFRKTFATALFSRFFFYPSRIIQRIRSGAPRVKERLGA